MVDFTTLHPFDFDRNLFNFLVSLSNEMMQAIASYTRQPAINSKHSSPITPGALMGTKLCNDVMSLKFHHINSCTIVIYL